MPQEENEISWFNGFKEAMNVVFTKEDFEKYKKGVEKELDFYKKYLKHGAKVLDIGCGLGCQAVPLSSFGYEVTGIDNDKDVVEATKQNAKNFGKNMKVVYGDIFDVSKMFDKDSFNVCMSGGVLEHFPEDQIRELVDKQLYVAPIVIASMPIATKEENVRERYKDYKRRICKDGIYRNMWTADYWINNVFKGYNIVEYEIGKASEAIGGFDEIIVVIRR